MNQFSKVYKTAVLVTLASAVACGSHQDSDPLRPNVILILADDLGYSDLGCYGGEIRTPNLDQLAEGGLRFGQFYNTAKCGPTRESLLSGLYSQDTGVGIQRGTTLGEEMQAAGYATMAVGKWHLKGSENPVHRGFGRYFGHLNGATNYFRGDPSFRLDDQPIEISSEDFYTTDAFTDYGITFIEEARSEDPERPFFLYLAFNAPHAPLQAWPEDIERYRGQYLQGWDRLRERRYQRQVEIGLVQKEWALSQRPEAIPPWHSLSQQEKELEDHRMAVYAAMVDRIDQNIGRLMAKLREWRIEDDTLVIFLSDNGGNPFEGKHRGTVGSPDSFWFTGVGWANLSNTPFRLYKRNQHNGGITTPFIAHWPRFIRDAGRIVDSPAHVIDIMPTLVSLCGKPISETTAGGKYRSLPGQNLLPVFKGASSPSRNLFFSFLNHRAFITGDWKLVSAYGQPWELYRTDIDRTETLNLAASQPDRARAMARQWEDWWKQTPAGSRQLEDHGEPQYIRLPVKDDDNMAPTRTSHR